MRWFCLVAALSLVACKSSSLSKLSDLGTGGDAAANHDLGPDMMPLPPGCADAVKDGDETDVDCGGSCAPCAANQRCSVGPDCVTTSCVNGYCALVSGPPNWVMLAPMAKGRGYLTVLGSGDGRIWALSGAIDRYGDGDGSCEVYIPRINTWSSAASLNPASVYGAGTVGPDGKLYVAGGLAGSSSAVSAVQVLDPTAGAPSWTTATPMSETRFHFGMASSVAESRIYVFGGGQGAVSLANVESAPPGATAWTARAPLPAAAEVSAATGSDGLIYVMNGTAGYVYDPAHDSFSATPIATPPSPIAGSLEVTGPDGRIYMVGNGNPSLAYTPSTHTWTAVARTLAPHSAGGATVGADGRIYLAGGGAGGDANAGTAVWSTAFESYGPILTASSPPDPTGAIKVTGSNFAAGATVRIYLDTIGGTPLATGKTDAAGNLIGSLSVQLPTTPNHFYSVIAVDNHSEYPVSVRALTCPCSRRP